MLPALLLAASLGAPVCPRPIDIPTALSCHILKNGAPDPSCASGEAQTNDLDVICHQKTSERRCTFDKSVKTALLKAYGLKSAQEFDHLWSLELGGSNSPKNVWPQQTKVAQKDKLENRLHKAVCSGKLSLAAARQIVADPKNWK
jgi:hypothetical protein